MRNSGLADKELAPFYIYYTVVFMSMATVTTFLNVYFEETLGFSLTQVGIIASVGPLVSIFAQPMWGVLSDRTNRRRVLMILTSGLIIVALLFPLHYAFAYVVFMAIFYTMFTNSMGPMADAITLQAVEKKRIKFNTIRMMGTISYGLMALVVGHLVGEEFVRIFYFQAVLVGVALFAVFWMPNVQDASSGTNDAPVRPSLKESLKELLGNKMVLCVLLSTLVFALATTFYHSFVAIQLRNLGATEAQVGRAVFLAAASEVPVLLFVSRLFGKRKPIHLLMIVGAFMTVRLLLLYVADVQDSLALTVSTQLLHGLTFMLHFYFSTVLLNKYAPLHLKSTVQSLNAVMRAIAAMLGAGLGGMLADQWGIGQIYLWLSIFVFALCFILPGIFAVIYRDKVRQMDGVVEGG